MSGTEIQLKHIPFLVLICLFLFFPFLFFLGSPKTLVHWARFQKTGASSIFLMGNCFFFLFFSFSFVPSFLCCFVFSFSLFLDITEPNLELPHSHSNGLPFGSSLCHKIWRVVKASSNFMKHWSFFSLVFLSTSFFLVTSFNSKLLLIITNRRKLNL